MFNIKKNATKIAAVSLAAIMSLSNFASLPASSGLFSSEEDTTQVVDYKSVEGKLENSNFSHMTNNDQFKYDVYSHYVKIREYIGTNSNVVVPSELEGLPVLSIADEVFQESQTIKSIIIGENVAEIGECCFKDCVELTSVTFVGNILKTIGVEAFSGCSKLKNIVLPGSVELVGEEAFCGCERLQSIRFEDSKLEECILEERCFAECPLLEKLWLPASFDTIDEFVLEDSNPDVMIYGYPESGAAILASNICCYFTVCDKSKYNTSYEGTSKVENKKIGQEALGLGHNIKIESAKIIPGSIKYKLAGESHTDNIANTERVLIFNILYQNKTDVQELVSYFDVNVTVDGYERRISDYGNLVTTDGEVGSLFAVVEPGQTVKGYIAVKVPADFENVTIVFEQDVQLEKYKFQISKSEMTQTGTSTSDPVTEDAENVVVVDEPVILVEETTVQEQDVTAENVTE